MSASLSQAVSETLLTDGTVGDRRRRSRPSTRESSTASRIDHRGQPQVFHMDSERRGRAGSRSRQGTPVPGVVTPPTASPLDGLGGNPSSPGPDAPQEELRQWSVGMFLQHETILRDVFTRLAGDSAALTQRVAQLENGHAAAAQVISNVVVGLDETRVSAANADTVLRSELVASAEKLKLSEDYVKGQVEGAFSTLDIKLAKFESLMTASAATSSSTGAATSPEGSVNVGIAQAYEIKVITAALQELGANRVNVQTQLASLASRPCHCPDVDKLMSDMTASGTASAQAFSRIQAM